MPDAKTVHAKLCKDHQTAAEQYVEKRAIAYAAFQNLAEACEDAKKTLIASGALKVDQDGNIKAGWYKSAAGYENHGVKSANNAGVGAAGSITGIAGVIGAPAAAWMLVGTFGTASTGAAIGGLSGAAATSATAAWFGGGAVAAGGLGMAAAPFALSGIGVVAGLTILGVAALITSNRNSRKEKDMKYANATMQEAERRMEANASTLKNLEDWAKQVSNQLIKRTGVLEAVKTDEAVAWLNQALKEAEQLFVELQKELPHTRLYIGRPSLIQSVIDTTATRNSISMIWKDRDNGKSEISGYNVWYDGGFWEGAKFLTRTQKPEFTHTRLEPGKTYSYKIIPVNMIGEADDQRYFPFEGKTQPV